MNIIMAMKLGIPKRKEVLTNYCLSCDMESKECGSLGVLHYYLGDKKNKAKAEAVIKRTANWFNLCPYKGRSPQGECDFAANRLVRVLYTGVDELSKETFEMIKEFFLKNNFESHYKSENHMLIFHISRYLAANIFKWDIFKAYGKTGEELMAEDDKYIREYLTFRAKRGWGEFDSVGYMAEDFGALMTLYDFSPNEELKLLSRMTMDLLLMDMLMDCNSNGFYCGAHGRIYSQAALNHLNSPMFTLYMLYFGSAYFDALDSYDMSNIACDTVMSTYIPSDFVFEAAANKPHTYENFEAKHLHSITNPVPHKKLPEEKGAISKYLYVCPEYSLGGVCFQDVYENPEGEWYAHHQQHEWELTFPNDSRAKIFTHHPGCGGQEGQEHGYWTGDLGCCCGTFYSNKNKAIAMYDIPDGQEYEINANVFYDIYDIETDDKRIFIKCEKAFAMLYFSEGFYKHTDGRFPEREIRSKGKKHAVVCEVGTQNKYADFNEFINAMKAKKVVFNKDKMLVEYDGIRITKDERYFNGKKVEFPFPLFKNPFINSELGSGIVTVTVPCGKWVMDFNEISIKKID